MKPVNRGIRLEFMHTLNVESQDGVFISKSVSDEIHFHLNGSVSKQN
jgi:hypothetical protein